MKNNLTALVGRDFTEQKTCKIELPCTVVYQGLTVKSTPPQTQGSGIKKYMQRKDDKVFPERLSVKDKRRDIIGRFSGT